VAAFESIRRSSAPEMVVEQILKKLKDGELQPGSQLPSQREMAQLFGVGRSSVREATNALAVMGYLEVQQGKGTFIRDNLPSTDFSTAHLNAALKAGSLLDLMEARELLECKSVELAAERAGTEHIRRMKAALAKAEDSRADYPAFLKADLEFHISLAEATENVVICEMMKLVVEKVLEHHSRLRTAHLSKDFRRVSIETARMIIEHLEKGEGQEAAQYMRDHLNAIKTELKDIIS
jgi:GntR family transcriptional repressor for pyruvate dehydrogenase complex